MASTGILLYQTEDGVPGIEVTLKDQTVWLSRSQMSELFQREKSVISKHSSNIFQTGELDEKSNVQKMHIALPDKPISTFSLDVIIAVGYRVNSHRGTQFRIWATTKLREYLVKGFVMDDERLGGRNADYFDELVERVRRIRTSERNFYEKVRDIFATSIDYDPKTSHAKHFYATVQNKFHFAITGHTTAELVAQRVNSNKPHMGLTNWQGEIITAAQARVAKNYLGELDIMRLELLVEQFLSFAELRSIEKTPCIWQTGNKSSMSSWC